MVGAVVRVLAAALLNVAIDVEVLDACGERPGVREFVLWADGEACGVRCRAPVTDAKT